MCADFHLQFSKNPAIYYTGKNVEAVITTDKGIGIKVKMEGRVKSRYRTRQEHFGEEISILVEKEVHFPNEGKDINGKEFHFSFLLPPHLPANFMQKNGIGVEYYLKVEVSKGIVGVVLNALQKNKFPFEVRSSICLSLHPLWKEKVIVEKENNVNCFRSGKAGYKFQLFKREYVAGEPVQFRGMFYNNSKQQIGTKLSLIQFIIVGSCKERINITRKDLQHLKGPKVGPGETKVWDWFDETQTKSPQLCIPQDTFTSECSGQFLCVNYVWIEMTVNRGLYKSRYTDRIYIKVGSTPTKYSPDRDWLDSHQHLTDPWLRNDHRIKFLKLK